MEVRLMLSKINKFFVNSAFVFSYCSSATVCLCFSIDNSPESIVPFAKFFSAIS